MKTTHPISGYDYTARTSLVAPRIRRVVFSTQGEPIGNRMAARLQIEGYEVLFAPNPEATRRWALGRNDTAVVIRLAADTEGSLLATAKVLTALPGTKVIIWAAQPDERLQQFAELMGAAFVTEAEGPQQLWAAIVE